MTKHVAVLMGGLSREREVSFSSGKGIANALRTCGYKVTEVDVGRDIAGVLAKLKPDIVFNALHGTYGEDGCIQGLLEIMQIPYTHSGVMASAIAMDKEMTKRILSHSGILCPFSKRITVEELAEGDPIPRPYVVKPVSEGSSVGVYIIREKDNGPNLKELRSYSDLMVETYIDGKELTVAVVDSGPLGVIEIQPKSEFYNYKNKYTAGQTEYIIPAKVSKEIYEKAMEIAYNAHKIIGCHSVSRSDFRYDGDKLYFMEINTHPGFTPTSLVPKAALYNGMTFESFVQKLVEDAKYEKR